MKVRIKLFAAARELVGCNELELEVDDPAMIADIRCALERAHPELQTIMRHALWAIDAEYADEQTLVSQHSDIALIPPVSGG